MTATPHNHIFILMGVSGSGKSVVATTLAHDLSAVFLDGDFLHPRANINKMASGYPLNDDDRIPWLNAINDAAFAMQRTNPISIIVCSALKKQYRDRLRKGNYNLWFIYLQGHLEVIEERLKLRQSHFFKPQLLVSQFKTLEEPGKDETDVHAVNIDQPLEQVISDSLAWIRTITAGQNVVRSTCQHRLDQAQHK